MIRILIADPDSATRKALALLLRRKLGTDGIVEIQDVETLIRALADMPPDLLLLDWRLYGSPAPETCRLLQKAYPHLKIVLLSVDAGDAAAAREAGANFIYKGALPDELIATLTALLQNASNPQPGACQQDENQTKRSHTESSTEGT
jgi:DNA-binding NarL/FixJ family response regulator